MKLVIPNHETVYYQKLIKLENTFIKPAIKPRDAIARERGVEGVRFQILFLN